MKLTALFATLLLLINGLFAADVPADIITTLKTDGRFKALSSALDNAQLSEALRISGAITFFAPTDDAFNKLPDLAALMNDKPRLTALLKRHFVVDRKIFAADLANMNAVVVSDGSTLRVSEGGKRIGDANVVTADIPAGNGLIHAIDSVFPLLAAPVVSEVRINDGDTVTTTTTTINAAPAETRAVESRNDFREAGSTVSTSVKSGAYKVGDGVKTGAEKVGDGVKSGAGTVGDGVKSGAGTVGDGLKTGASKIKHAFGF